MIRYRKFIFTFIYMVGLAACSSPSSNNLTKPDHTNGTINISVDENFKHIIQQQIQMYQNTYPNATIHVAYKPEVECFKDLLKDSVSMIITARNLTPSDAESLKSNLGHYANVNNVAYDAVAAIVNINNTDSVFTYQDIKNILSGQKNYTVIVDGNNATSTVKYLQDSVLKGLPFGKNVVATHGADSVITIIKHTQNAIGFVSSSLVSNLNETNQVNNLKQIKLALVECLICPDKPTFAKASQATLTYGQYPLARPLYYINKESWHGVSSGLANFLSGERGQLIFRRAGFATAKISFNKRTTSLKSK